MPGLRTHRARGGCTFFGPLLQLGAQLLGIHRAVPAGTGQAPALPSGPPEATCCAACNAHCVLQMCAGLLRGSAGPPSYLLGSVPTRPLPPPLRQAYSLAAGLVAACARPPTVLRLGSVVELCGLSPLLEAPAAAGLRLALLQPRRNPDLHRQAHAEEERRGALRERLLRTTPPPARPA